MANLDGKLQQWVDLGLLDADQADRIRLHESSSTGRNWALYSVVGVGVVAMMTGVVSVIAANWEEISDSTKLTAFFVFFGLLSVGLCRRYQRSGVVREAILTIWASAILAGIGLIGQVFNLESDGYSAIYFWISLFLPALWFAESQLINHLWLAGFVFATGAWISAHDYLFRDQLFTVQLWCLALAFTWVAIAFAGRIVFLPARFTRAVLQWVTAGCLVVLTPYGNLLWAAHAYTVQPIEAGLHVAALAAIAAAILAAVAVTFNHYQLAPRVRRSIVACLAVLAVMLIVPPLTRITDHDIIGCALFLLVWTFAASAAAGSGRKRLFDLATFVVAARFVVVYFEVFGSLAATGIGLIISGLVILGAAYVWHSYRQRVAALIAQRAAKSLTD